MKYFELLIAPRRAAFNSFTSNQQSHKSYAQSVRVIDFDVPAQNKKALPDLFIVINPVCKGHMTAPPPLTPCSHTNRQPCVLKRKLELRKKKNIDRNFTTLLQQPSKRESFNKKPLERSNNVFLYHDSAIFINMSGTYPPLP